MNVSIKKRIYWSFFILVFLFVVNGIASLITLNNNRKLSEHVSTVVDPSLESLEDFEDLLIASKMYTTNWVFLRSNQDDKDALKRLHNIDYPSLKVKLSLLSGKWDNKHMTDSLHKIYTGFEQLLVVEKGVMLSLQKFGDYDDPVAKFESERMIEDEVLPRTSTLINALSGIVLYEQNIRNQKNKDLEDYSMRIRMLILVRSITIIFIGIFLSLYIIRKIINPINKIRHIVNDLGKGIVGQVNHKSGKDEIGEMVRSVNNLSNKLQATATFAQEVGLRNFTSYFEPLSKQDTLGKALVTMRDNLKTSDESLNEAQHIAKLGSWEWDIVSNKVFWSDEVYNIFDIDPTTFNPSYEGYFGFIHPEDKEYANNIISKCLENHQPFSYECRVISEKKVAKITFAEGKISKNDKGEIIKLTGIVQDITERKKAEEALRGSEKHLRQIIDLVPHFIFAKDAKGNYSLANEAVARAYGCTVEDLIGKNDADFNTNKEETEHFMRADLEVINSGIAKYNIEEMITDAAGTSRILSTTKIPYTSPGVDIPGLLGVSVDISERKKAETVLKESESQLSIASQIAKLGYWEFDVLKGLFTFNDQFYSIYQTTAEEVGGYTMTNDRYAELFVYAGDRAAVATEVENAINSADPHFSRHMEHRIIYANGDIGWISVHSNLVKDDEGHTIKTFGVNQDITERKKAEIALLESQKQIQTIFDAALDAIVIIDEEGKIVKYDSKSEVLFGWKQDEVLGRLLTETIIPHQHREAHARGMKHFLKTGEGPILGKTIEVRALKKNNDEFDISLSISPSLINGKYQFIGFIRDITSRKKAETELHNSEERYRQIVETAQEGIWMVDENNRTNFVNKRLCEIFGYSHEEMMGKELFYFMDDEGKKIAEAGMEKRRQGSSKTFDFKFLTKENSVIWAYLATSPVLDDTGKYIGALAMVTDITKRKHDQELLEKSRSNLAINNQVLEQKNRELEQFAFVASHDLQEPLRTISDFVGLLRQQYQGKLDKKADKCLAYIVQSSDRMKIFVSDLLQYSRIGNEQANERVNCAAVLREVLADLGKAIEETSADIETGPLPFISGHPSEIKQLFQNLIVNAIKFRKKDSIPKIKISARKKDDCWQFTFADNGIGIEEQHKERIFVIFQRLHTRSEYQGSGIGLSNCKKIVELYNGKIWVDSKPGEGSTFQFTIHQNNN